MKNIFSILIAGIILFSISCKDNNIVNPPIDNKDYFPAKVGAKYVYNLTIDTSLVLNGARISDVVNTTTISGTDYFVQIDSVIIERVLTLDTAYFRKSNTGVFFYVDTTGLTTLIPDSIRNSLRIDIESRLLFFPIQVNQTWPVYQIDITLGGIPIFSPVKTSAKVLETQQLTVNFRGSQQTIDVYKIEYKLEVQLDPRTPAESFYAYGYIAENIGFVKWEGESFVLNLIRGGRLDLTFPSGFYTELLNDYFIP